MSNVPDSPNGKGHAESVVVIVCAIAFAAQGLAYVLRGGRLWGADAYAFFGPWVFALAGVVTVAVAIRALRSNRAAAAPRPGPERRGPGDAWIHAGLAVVGAALFLLFRSAHVLLGDGIAIITSLPSDSALHALEPASMLLEQATFGILNPLLAQGRDPWHVAWLSAAVLSVVSGAVFLPVAWAVAKHLTRRIPGVATPPTNAVLLAAIVALLLLAQGYVQLFFGYVEIYALSAAAIAVYALTALRTLDDGKPVWPAATALSVAVALHLSALALTPSFALLALGAWTDRARRPGRGRDVALTAAVLALVPVLMLVAGRGYNLVATAASVVGGVLRQPEPLPHYFWSVRHLQDIVNEQLLIGPLALWLFVPALALALPRLVRRRETAFFALLGLGFAVAALIAGDSNLGYARNWDLLAPSGLALTIAGLGLLLPRFRDARSARALLLVAVAVSAFHTVPWIAVNASSARGLERFTTLPLELGRMESTVGYWCSLQGDTLEAERWFARALDRYPGNVRACVNLGEIYRQRGDFARAARAYTAAAEINPESDEFRLLLVDALVRSGELDDALPEIRRLVGREPRDPRILTVYGIVLLGMQRPDAAREAFVAAQRSAPESLIYRLVGNYAELPHGYERAMNEVWEAMIRG